MSTPHLRSRQERRTRGGTHPYEPDSHTALHRTLACAHCPSTGLSSIASRGRGKSESLECFVNVEEHVGQAENWHYEGHGGGVGV